MNPLAANGVVLEGTFGDWATERWRGSPAQESDAMTDQPGTPDTPFRLEEATIDELLPRQSF